MSKSFIFFRKGFPNSRLVQSSPTLCSFFVYPIFNRVEIFELDDSWMEF